MLAALPAVALPAETEEKGRHLPVVDNYALLLEASASDVVHPEGERSGHWAGHSKPVSVSPEQLVSLFASRTKQLLAEHEKDEKYETAHWAQRLAVYDSRDGYTPQRADVCDILTKHALARKQSFAVLEKALDDAEKTKMEPVQLHAELAGFEVAIPALEIEAQESVDLFEATIRDLQSAAPRVAQRQLSRVHAEIESKMERSTTVLQEVDEVDKAPFETDRDPISPGQGSTAAGLSHWAIEESVVMHPG